MTSTGTKTPSGPPGMQQVDITSLDISQLNQLKQQVEQELEHFSSSFQQLSTARSKFQESGNSVAKLTADNLNKDILVPLTGSMYIPGRLSDVESVLVDIGTGYYAEKNVADANDYFKRKADYVKKQCEKLEVILNEKNRMRQLVVEVMQMKVQAQLQSASQGQRPTAVAKW